MELCLGNFTVATFTYTFCNVLVSREASESFSFHVCGIIDWDCEKCEFTLELHVLCLRTQILNPQFFSPSQSSVHTEQ